MYEILDRVLITKEKLEKRVDELGKQLDKDYKDTIPLMVCILNGSVVFYTDLIRAMKNNLELDFMSISSYGDDFVSSGKVKMIKDLDKSIENRDVVIVEDIIDSGYTMSYLLKLLKERNPKSIKVLTLLDKASRRQTDVKIDYVGFEIGDEFIVGYGLDYLGLYRNIPEVGVLKASMYK